QLTAQAQTLKQRQCAALYSQYQRQLVQQRRYDLEGRQWYARDLLGRGQRRPFEAVRFVFVDGFTEFTRTQREILDALAQQSEELWIALPNEPGEERGELFFRPHQTVARLKPLQPQVSWLPTRTARKAPPALPAGLAHL